MVTSDYRWTLTDVQKMLKKYEEKGFALCPNDGQMLFFNLERPAGKPGELKLLCRDCGGYARQTLDLQGNVEVLR